MGALQQLHVTPVLRTPHLDAVLQVSPHSRVEGQDCLPRPADHTAFDAGQDIVGFLGCEGTLLAHVQLPSTSTPQSFFNRAAEHHTYIPQLVLTVGVAMTQVQDPALAFVEPREALLGPLLEPV